MIVEGHVQGPYYGVYRMAFKSEGSQRTGNAPICNPDAFPMGIKSGMRGVFDIQPDVDCRGVTPGIHATGAVKVLSIIGSIIEGPPFPPQRNPVVNAPPKPTATKPPSPKGSGVEKPQIAAPVGETTMARPMYGLNYQTSSRIIAPAQDNIFKKALGWAGDFVKDAIPGPVDDMVIDRLTRGRRGPGSRPPASRGLTSCPQGYRNEGGQCVETGWRGVAERVLPGGQSGTMVDEYGEAVLGSFGIPALVPAQVGQIHGNPILRCPPGAVLGKDNLCYQKSSIPKAFRKWKPAAKPPMTAADARALRRIGTLQNRVKRLASSAGMTAKKSKR